MSAQHGAVAGRAVPGTGNASAIEAQQQADLGDPATDLIGTWRLSPGDPDEWRRQYDLAQPRAVKVDDGEWRVVCPVEPYAGPCHGDMTLGDRDVQAWPYTTSTVVRAAASLHRRRTLGGPEPERVLPTIVEGDEGEYLFRGPR